MKLPLVAGIVSALAALANAATTNSTQGVLDLVQRRLPNHVNDFTFVLTNQSYTTNITQAPNDHYTVSNAANGKIQISGNSPIALTSGLRWYLSNIAHVDIFWFIGSRLHLAPYQLPKMNGTYTGSSIVPWRYHFNTVTFSYTAAWWDWEDWELQLDWMALRGINLPLASVGQEKIIYDVFHEAGFTDPEIYSFFSGPAYQAWNRFGNIQGSWNGTLPSSWINEQFALNQQIVQRMVQLGMTPVLPCFTGFVPRAISRVAPNADFVNGSRWNNFPTQYTNTTFLQPLDPLFSTLQKSFISKQAAAYGNVSHIYTLDFFNENNPESGNTSYLQNLTHATWQAFKNADPQAVWLTQGWLFFSNSAFWTNDRIQAYLSGVPVNSDILILDLFSETQPQWQRTNSYYGKPWIWCELHDYGGNMGLYGQIENVTVNPVAALANSSSLVGFGLTMEGEEGNEIIYDVLLDQAWSRTPLNSSTYFSQWVTSRYSGARTLPTNLYKCWDILRQTVYNNTQLATQAETKSIFVLAPNTTGLLNRTGHHPTTITYPVNDLVLAWSYFYNASIIEPSLWDNPSYTFDLVDMTRQVLANAFVPQYTTLLSTSNHTLNTTYSPTAAKKAGQSLLSLLSDLDLLLTTSAIPHFNLAPWLASARSWATTSTNTSALLNSTTALNATQSATVTTIADFYEYTARNQITLWGPTGQISDYASKQWGGLIRSYYLPRWEMFVASLLDGNGTAANGANAQLSRDLLAFEEEWQGQIWGEEEGESYAGVQAGDLPGVIAQVVRRWPAVFTV
ncbi:hypothetical protein MBLNU457_g0518t1 [Dothideomycetes sp. NU457]